MLSLAIAVAVSALLLSWLEWPETGRGVEFAALMLAAVAASLQRSESANADWSILRLGFVFELMALMMFGPAPALAVAACGLLTRDLSQAVRRPGPWRRVLNAATVLLALMAAGWSYLTFGGTLNNFTWPWQAGPVVSAVCAYAVVTSASIDLLLPLVMRRPLRNALRQWPLRILQGCPVHIIAASVAVVLVEMIVRAQWALLPVAAVPLFLASRLYRDQLGGLQQGGRCAAAFESLEDGVCMVDRSGDVTLWNDALEQLLDCPRDRALGRQLRTACAALAGTELLRTLDEVRTGRQPCTIPRLELRSTGSPRIVQVKLLPVTGGVTLLWRDVTEQVRDVQALQRQGERLGLAAEAANDGLWEWDLGTQQFFVTGPWKAMVGLPASAGVTRPEAWLDRVHSDDIAPLKEALEAHISGATERFQHEHRIRHEDGTYRFFQCRGMAVRRGPGRAGRIAGSLTDTTDLAMTQERLRLAVYLDPLTALYNRAVFVEGLGRRLKEFHRRRGVTSSHCCTSTSIVSRL